MSKITLNAAPSLSTVAYYIDVAGTALSAAAAHTDAAEVVIGGVHTGTYQAAEPSAYLGILWTDGTVWKYVPNSAADTVNALLSNRQWWDVHAYTAGDTAYNATTKTETITDVINGTAQGSPQIGFSLTIVNGQTTSRVRTL